MPRNWANCPLSGALVWQGLVETAMPCSPRVSYQAPRPTGGVGPWTCSIGTGRTRAEFLFLLLLSSATAHCLRYQHHRASMPPALNARWRPPVDNLA